MSIPPNILLRDPLVRPSSKNGSYTTDTSLLRGPSALQRFTEERMVLEDQLKDCQAFYTTLLEIRKRRKAGETTLTQNVELAEGFHVKTEVHDTETFVVSLGLQDAYIELELEEAIAYCQRREEYLRVSLKRLEARLQGLQAEQKMDMASLYELVERMPGLA